MRHIKFWVEKDRYGLNRVELWLFGIGDNKQYVISFNEDGTIKETEYPENTAGRPPGKPVFTISGYSHLADKILKAMVEGLKQAGYVAEVDNAERITSEALAKEREKENEYLKNTNKDIIKMIMEKI